MGAPLSLTLRNFKAASRKRNMVDFCLMDARQDLSWIADSASGTPINPVLQSNGTYQLTSPFSGFPVAPVGSIDVYLNGLHLTGGLGYTVYGSILTFLPGYVPSDTDTITVQL